MTGFVEDLRPHLSSAAAIVVPLRLGGGTRLKIVEGMAMSKAIVSTTLGAEGLGWMVVVRVVTAWDCEWQPVNPTSRSSAIETPAPTLRGGRR